MNQNQYAGSYEFWQEYLEGYDELDDMPDCPFCGGLLTVDNEVGVIACDGCRCCYNPLEFLAKKLYGWNDRRRIIKEYFPCVESYCKTRHRYGILSI